MIPNNFEDLLFFLRITTANDVDDDDDGNNDDDEDDGNNDDDEEDEEDDDNEEDDDEDDNDDDDSERALSGRFPTKESIVSSNLTVQDQIVERLYFIFLCSL